MSDHLVPRRVLLAGATGLVGREILRALLADHAVTEIHVLSRRALDQSDPRVQVHIVDFARLPSLPRVDEVYLALGTTIRVAGSEQAFRAVDLEANLAVATLAAAAGATRAGLVSAVGADAQSRVFYNRVKGELEAALKPLFPALVIAQPSLLLGDRSSLNQPLRWGERIAAPIGRLVSPLLPGRYRPVAASAVAAALVRAVPIARGLRVLPSDELAMIGH
ncbi:NAD-dependent epimerase/dehydratase family protein [Massilia sp. Mn16-1_5]|uniref:NAD-dependent epimerase/dehydratase family protein n=1 Tax=Massilia sp. Mn16-1_5 TaxID=2079199 RepID=UPI00109E3AA6|nr:NAD-dependent epimerase/dehydratase family protein [Massilia sp. Mn16-1_5]THC46310.1 nucleoside-diphosphate sugar epimerase [Massilia sp. Mn16-1_5]